MSINLTLIPDRFGFSKGMSIHAHTMLPLYWQDACFFTRLHNEAIPLKSPILLYNDDEGMTSEAEDCYGDPLTYMPANLLCSHLQYIIEENLKPWDRAVIAFVKALPSDMKVVLWWC